MKAIIIPNGILHLAESLAVCPHCERDIPFEEIEPKWEKSNSGEIKMKCKCKRFVRITTTMKGDFIAY